MKVKIKDLEIECTIEEFEEIVSRGIIETNVKPEDYKEEQPKERSLKKSELTDLDKIFGPVTTPYKPPSMQTVAVYGCMQPQVDVTPLYGCKTPAEDLVTLTSGTSKATVTAKKELNVTTFLDDKLDPAEIGKQAGLCGIEMSMLPPKKKGEDECQSTQS